MKKSVKKATEIFELMTAADTPDAIDESMVCQLWFDGEITLQKGGSLFGRRSLHMIQEGKLPEEHIVSKILKDVLVEEFNREFIFLKSVKQAEEITKFFTETEI